MQILGHYNLQKYLNLNWDFIVLKNMDFSVKDWQRFYTQYVSDIPNNLSPFDVEAGFIASGHIFESLGSIISRKDNIQEVTR